MNTLISFLSLIIILTSCDFLVSPDKPKETKVQIEEVNKAGNFEKIHIGGASDLLMKQGDKCKVSLSGNDKHFKYVILEVRGNTLVSKTVDGCPSNLDVQINVTLPNVTDVRLSGAGVLIMENFSDLSELDISLSGAGTFETKGKPTNVKTLEISISGAGSIDAENLKAENVDVSVSGAGSADVYASKNLEASVSGIGSIEYSGNPKVRKRVSGIGSIGKK